ncbi:MAG: hypothetical protein DIZ80_04230 [endosymbiont of Galathealinum brachiosum]|uniref:Globin family profile domain-containing protein n=1 Tax=endosymbiont of Galathealinum brachiosum TaxID=2200906 RepID=A0A370DIG9_9GAMM|nr:MAG: hypothetical protein DIZ80_04230 [endosymbiont of Galathealinum brachiosum]
MAREKKSMIGFDPLAWLDDSSDSKSAPEDNKETPAAAKKKPAEKQKKDTANMIMVLGHSIDETALLKGYGLATDVLEETVVDFYDELFTRYPAVKPLFENTEEKAQAGKLAAALKLLVDNLHNEDALKATLTVMGERHQGYGALPDHYPVVAELLIASFKKIIGRSWTKAISAAWMELLVAGAETMCAAYKDEIVEVESVEPEIQETESVETLVDSGHPVLHLNSIQDISKSQALKHDMLALINDNDEIDIHASEVERIDGSALQLLCALFNYAHQNNLVINWINPSDILKESAQILGMQQILELQ